MVSRVVVAAVYIATFSAAFTGCAIARPRASHSALPAVHVPWKLSRTVKCFTDLVWHVTGRSSGHGSFTHPPRYV
eukprot:363812-Prymnesium_polylepis.1